MNNTSPQDHTINAADGISALYRTWNTPGYRRFIYGAYLILGIIFFGIAVFTALSIVLRFFHYDTAMTFKTALFLCYAVLNVIIGYGFIFYKKWLLVAFAGVLIHTELLAIANGETALPVGVFISVSILLFLFLTKNFLSGRYLAMKTVVPFMVLLLFSFLLTNFTVLN